MISFYKKVFLASLRFQFFETLFGGLASGLSGGISSGIGSLFSSSPSTQKDLYTARVASGMGPQPSSQEVAATSSPMLDPINVTDTKRSQMQKESWQNKAMSFAGDLAGKATSRVMEHMVDRGMSGLFEKSAKQRAMDDWKYDRIRYPGVTPWEINSGSSGSSGQGGQAPAEIQSSSRRLGSAMGAGATTDAAQISTSPQIKKIEYLTGAERDKLDSETDKNHQERRNLKVENEYIKPLRQAQVELQKGQTKQAINQVSLIRKQVLSEVQKERLQGANADVQRAYANILRLPRTQQGIADFMLAISTFASVGIIGGAAVTGLKRLLPARRMKKISGPKGKPPVKGGPGWRTRRQQFKETFKNSRHPWD